MPLRLIKKLCFHTWKLSESAGRIFMTKLPSIVCAGMLNFFLNMDQLSCLPGDFLNTPQKSILSITWIYCINYRGSRIHYSPQLFSNSVLYQTWSDAIKIVKRFNLACYSVSHGRNNTSVLLIRKAVSQVYFLQS